MLIKNFPIKTAGSGDNASLTVYILDGSTDYEHSVRPLVLICPGGGYEFVSTKEGEPMALQFTAMGYHAAILRYSVRPAVYPTQLLEAAAAWKIIREHAEEWNIQADSFRLKGKTLGVIGAGRIARALIRKVSGFGFAEVVAYDPYISAEQLAEIGVRKVEKEELFRISDIISLHLHANAETNGMICKETLALMKPTAILINVSRGPLVKDEDLLDALRGHRILAAGLDTHNHEPLGAQSPFCQLDNVVLTDHTAYSTAEGVTELKTKAAQNVVDVLEGRTPRYPVNHL